jgi:hypothetical protein
MRVVFLRGFAGVASPWQRLQEEPIGRAGIHLEMNRELK